MNASSVAPSPSKQSEVLDLTSPSESPVSSCSSEHPLLAGLLTKKRVIGTLPSCIELLSNLMKEDVEKFLLESLDGEAQLKQV